MRKSFLIAILFLFFVSLSPLNAQWARTYGGEGVRDDAGYVVQETADGGYIVAGKKAYYYSGFPDIWILKLDMNGEIEWEQVYGGPDSEYALSIQQTADEGYIVAGYTNSLGLGDLFVLKLSSDGAMEWQYAYTGGSFSAETCSIQQTIDGGYIVAGEIDFGTGDDKGWADFWVLKLDSFGEIEWQKAYGGINVELPHSVHQTSDGGYIIAGVTSSFGAGYQDAWILKLSSIGEIEWQKTYGGPSFEIVHSLALTEDNGYVVTGYIYSLGAGGGDFWVLKLDSFGEIEWQKTYGGSDDEWPYSIQQASDGGYIVAGETFSFNVGDMDAWALKLSSIGEIEWQKAYGGSYSDTARSIQQRSNGGYILTGETGSFGAGGMDVWVLKITSKGLIGLSCSQPWITDTSASISESYIFPEETFATSKETDVVPLATEFSSRFSATFINVLCETPLYNLVIDANTGGITDPEPGEYIHEFGDEVSVIAIPENGNGFDNWTGDIPEGHENDNPITITMDSDKSLTANFTFHYSLTIVAGIGGTTDPVPDTYTHDPEEEITVTAITDIGYRFNAWTGDIPEGHENDNPITITMDSDKSLTANFIQQYTLTITAGAGGTTNPIPGDYIYDSGAEATITAVSGEGYQFLEWSGDATGTTNPITITMDSDKSVTANFAQIQQYTLTISAGTGGTTNPTPGTYTHDLGTNVSIQATANSGYNFTGWSGDATGTTNPITITMDSDKSITANFQAEPEPPEPPEPEKEKEGCFIATAAYGTSLHPHINILREFRDKHLITNKPGRIFTNLYYKYSPSIAKFISKHKILKTIVRIHLHPLITFAYLTVH